MKRFSLVLPVLLMLVAMPVAGLSWGNWFSYCRGGEYGVGAYAFYGLPTTEPFVIGSVRAPGPVTRFDMRNLQFEGDWGVAVEAWYDYCAQQGLWACYSYFSPTADTTIDQPPAPLSLAPLTARVFDNLNVDSITAHERFRFHDALLAVRHYFCCASCIRSYGAVGVRYAYLEDRRIDDAILIEADNDTQRYLEECKTWGVGLGAVVGSDVIACRGIGFTGRAGISYLLGERHNRIRVEERAGGQLITLTAIPGQDTICFPTAELAVGFVYEQACRCVQFRAEVVYEQRVYLNSFLIVEPNSSYVGLSSPSNNLSGNPSYSIGFGGLRFGGSVRY